MTQSDHNTPNTIAQALRGVRRHARRMLVVQKIGWIVAWVIGVGLVLGVMDFFLRWPGWMRGVILVAGLLILAAALRRVVWRAVKFKPPLTEVALRVEASEAGREAGLRGVLASGLELSRGRGGGRPEIAASMVEDTAERVGRLDASRVFTGRKMGRSLVEAGVAVLVLVVVAASAPMLTRIGTVRTLTPWIEASWPKRTAVTDAVSAEVHPLGTAVALRAVLLKGHESSSASARPPIAAGYRLVIDGERGPMRRVLLTSQEKMTGGTRRAATQEERELQEGEELPGEGLLYERLIEPLGDAGASETAGKRVELEYWFESDDDATTPRSVLLVEPPSVERAVVSVRAPAYARGVLGDEPRRATIVGPGVHDVVVSAEGAVGSGEGGTILVGSSVRMELTLNKTLPTTAGRAWITRTLGEELADVEPRMSVDGSRWTLEWTMPSRNGPGGGVMVVPLRLVDEHGISAAEETAYRFASVADAPPTVSITRPEEDTSVLATAVVEIEAEARDDVGLSTLSIRRQHARRGAGTQSTQAEAIEDTVEMVSRPRVDEEPRRIVAGVRLDLSELKLEPGDEVWLTAAASDVLGAGSGETDTTHAAAMSSRRVLRILSRQQLVEQVWADLGTLRRSAIRLEEEQTQLERALERGEVGEAEASRQSRAQAGLTERIAGHRQAVARLAERLSDNGLADEALDRVMDEASAALSRAGERSVAAGDALAEAGRADAQQQPEEAAAAQRQAREAQQGVRDELASLIGMLDQGEDTWAMKRQIERALEEQRELIERTKQAGQEMVGKGVEQLSQGERQRLSEIAQDQQGTAERVREAVEEMLEREQALRKSDPAAAQAMAEAAKNAQRQRAAEKMDDAAQNVEQNQTSRAQQSQEQAAEALQEMLDTLEQGNKNRDEVLRRVLASLIESIKGLITKQEGELAALGEAIAAEREVRPLSEGMQQLHVSTLGVADEAAGSPREAAAVASVLARASEAQASAVVSLRAAEPSGEEARGHEDTSLARLNDALKAAEEANQRAESREERRKRDELRKAYMDALQKQVSIRDATTPMVGVEVTRRTRQQVRLLGEEEAGLKTTLDELRTGTAELSQAKMFEYAHERLAKRMGEAADELAKGEATPAAVRSQETAVRVLQSLVAALAETKAEKDFRDQEQSGGGSGGQSGGQQGGGQGMLPPIAEVKLLRAMQEEALTLTREAEALAKEGSAEGRDLAAAVADLQAELVRQGEALIQKMKQQQPGAGGGGGGIPEGGGDGGGAPIEPTGGGS